MNTLLLQRTAVARHMDALTLLSEMREALRADAGRGPPEPPGDQALLALDGGGAVSLAGTREGIPAYTRRVRGPRPGGEPATTDLIHLHDLETGGLLAVLDAGHLTALRLGVVGALAADVLARQDAARVALIGAGAPASMQLKSLGLVRSLEHVRVYDEDMARSVEFAARMYRALNLPVRPADSVEEAVTDADLVITLMPSREPLLHPGMLRGGTHVTVLEDEPGRAGLSAGLLRQSTVFCDHRGRVSPGTEGASPPVELGEVLAGTRPGRTDAAQVTLFRLGGLPAEELVAAWHVYQGARLDDEVPRVDFGA